MTHFDDSMNDSANYIPVQDWPSTHTGKSVKNGSANNPETDFNNTPNGQRRKTNRSLLRIRQRTTDWLVDRNVAIHDLSFAFATASRNSANSRRCSARLK